MVRIRRWTTFPTNEPLTGSLYWDNGKYKLIQNNGSNVDVYWREVTVLAGAIGGGFVLYLVNTNFIEPYKENLKKIKSII